MFAFKDFILPQVKPTGILVLAEYDMLDIAVQAANAWVLRESIQVINIETVVLPNMWQSGEAKAHNAMLRTSCNQSNEWYQFVRVWYQSE